MRELQDFVKLSKYAGERLDLVQAGGGNSSVKLNNGTMLIKASGFMLSEVELDKGYLKVKYQKILTILDNKKLLSLRDKEDRNSLAAKFLKEAIIDSTVKPSIETFLHALLYKYTLHIHPLVVNAVTCKKNCREILEDLFDGSILFVGYRTPGIELALDLKKFIERYKEKHNKKPKVTFIQNHGLIVSSDNLKEVIEDIENAVNKLENYLGLNLSRYKMTNKISVLVNSLKNTYCISYLSSDSELNKLIKTKRKLFFNRPFCPDILVYCGIQPLEIKNLEDRWPFIKYYKKYGQQPRVIIYNDYIFFIAKDLNKAKGIEDVFKFGILTLNIAKEKINFLNNEELLYLANWEAERYRHNQ